MFSTDFIFRQQENLVDNQKCQAGFRPLCNKILLLNYKNVGKNAKKSDCSFENGPPHYETIHPIL